MSPAASGPSLDRRRLVVARVAVAVARPLVALPPGLLCLVLKAVRTGAGPATESQALEARQAAVKVSARCAGLGCLQRSVATVLQCRLRGCWPDWCTGFRMEPFAAHAWVEVDGRPVGEPGDLGPFSIVLSVRR